MVAPGMHGGVHGFNLVGKGHGVEIALCLQDEFGHVPGLIYMYKPSIQVVCTKCSVRLWDIRNIKNMILTQKTQQEYP